MSFLTNIVPVAFTVMSLALVGCRSEKATTKFADKQDDAAMIAVASSVEKGLSAQIAILSKEVGVVPAGTTIESLDAQIEKVYAESGTRDERDPRLADRLKTPKAMRKLLVLTAEKNFLHTYPREIRGMREQVRARKMRKADTVELTKTLVQIEQKYEELYNTAFMAPAKELDQATKDLNDLRSLDSKYPSKSERTQLDMAQKNVKNAEAKIEKMITLKLDLTKELEALRAVTMISSKVKAEVSKTVVSIKGITASVQKRITEIYESANYHTDLPNQIMQLTWDLEDEQMNNPDTQPSFVANMITTNLKRARSNYAQLANKFISQEEKVLADMQTRLTYLKVKCEQECFYEKSLEEIELLEMKTIPAQVEKIKKMKADLEHFSDVNAKFVP